MMILKKQSLVPANLGRAMSYIHFHTIWSLSIYSEGAICVTHGEH